MTTAKTQPWQIVEAEFMAAAADGASMPPPISVEVAFAGRSNVGKSSLMNALMGRKRLVRTSSTPGCTRQINWFRVRARDGAMLNLVDLPGYGYAKRSKSERAQWSKLIEGYLLEREWLKAVVVLCDARHGLTDGDRAMLEFASAGGDRATIVVATKIDKLPKSKRKAVFNKLQQQSGARLIGCSAVTGDGIGELWRAIRRAAHIA